MKSINSRVTYRNATEIGEEISDAILAMRNLPEIRSGMYTDHLISSSEHKLWMNSLQESKRKLVYAVMLDANLAGVVNLNNLDAVHKTSDWGFYISPCYHGGGLGAIIEYDFIEHVFENFDLEKLNCEVLETNESVIKMHRKFGFREEGLFRKNIVKNGVRVDVVRFGLLKSEWHDERDRIEKIVSRAFR